MCMDIFKKSIFLYSFLAFQTFLLCGCDTDDDAIRQGAGYIHPDITFISDFTVYGTQNTVSLDMSSFIGETKITLSTSDNSYSHTWTLAEEFPENESFLPGDYKLTVSIGNDNSEGINMPFCLGESYFKLSDGEISKPQINVEPQTVPFFIDLDKTLSENFPDYNLILHSSGGKYISYDNNDNQPVFIKSGDIDIMLSIELPDGRTSVVKLVSIEDSQPNYIYDIHVSAINSDNAYPIIKTSYTPGSESEVTYVELTETNFDITEGILCSGFVSGEKFYTTEGTIPSAKLTMSIPNSNLKQLNLSADWLMMEVDILNGPGEFSSIGLVETIGETVILDYTDIIPTLRTSYSGQEFSLSLQAVYNDGSLSEPAILNIVPTSIDIEILSVMPIVSGINKGEIEISLPEIAENNLSLELLTGTEQWQPVSDIHIENTANNTCLITFNVPETETDVYVRILYCGSIKSTIKMERTWPRFDIQVDAFATKAAIRIIPKENDLMAYIVKNAEIYVDKTQLTILSFDSQNGIIWVTGLEPAKSYTLTASIKRDPRQDDFTSPVTVKTENIASLPNSDFEDIGPVIKYDNLPSGGRYSQNIVEIFNQQNLVDYNIEMPLGWANVNAKTVCTDASNPNTWYMQPSAQTITGDSYSEARSVKIINTAWDNTGASIPDYLQTGLPYTKYSLNIPEIKYKAVGKLFLGSYKFDSETLTETYDEGISFSSRPSSLNGFYKFIPVSASEEQMGFVHVEVIGRVENEEIVISENEIFLSPVTGFTAFNVPLSYNLFGVKATKVKVMFAASPHIGTIEYETEMIVTVPDPVTSSSTGNALWVDGISFTY